MTPLEQGATIGRYVLESRIASGGMADVWLARHRGARPSDPRVVVKSILPELARKPEFVHLFANEARLAASLRHRNIVRIYELLDEPTGLFISMEHVVGWTLREIHERSLAAGKVLPPWFVCRVCAEVCDALQHVHAARDERGRHLELVHRDIAPENVMVTCEGRAKVLDFGVAKASRQPTTRSGVLKGRLAYLAPERIDAHDGECDHRADIYALGVLMYELVTSRLPYRARNQVGLLRAIRSPDVCPPPPSGLANWLPASLERLILRALAKRPEARFPTAIEMRAALDDCLAGQGLYPARRHVEAHLRALFDGETAAPRSHRRRSARPTPLPELSPSSGRVGSTGRAARAVAAFEEGLEWIRSHDYPRALEALARALELQPDNRVYRSNFNKLRQRVGGS